MKTPRNVLAVVVLAFAAVVAASGVSAAAPPARISSYDIGSMTTTSAVVTWTTTRSAASVIHYGETTDYGTTVASPVGTRHQVTLTGLTSATQYQIRIEVVGKKSRVTDSATTSFRTLSDTDDRRDSCLDAPTTITIEDEWTGATYTGRIRPGHVGTGVAIDLRDTVIHVHDESQDGWDTDGKPLIDSRWGLVQLDSSTDLCVVGGEVISPNPHNITWAENYDTDGRTGYRQGTTRNHTAVDTAESLNPTVEGLSFFNLHDGIRVTNSIDWTVQHVWGDYTRDDCIENDEIAAGMVSDSLFDGCYAGYSNRPSDEFVAGGGTGRDNTIVFDRVLLRMEMMPGPHKACERTYLYYEADRSPYNDEPCVERDVYGTGPLFKIHDQDGQATIDDPQNAIDPTFDLIDSTFVVEQYPAGDDRANFPAKIGRCENVVIVYRGPLPYPGRLPPAGCYELLTGSPGETHWTQVVTAWHDRHPDVAPDRKDPSTYGDLTFPRPPFNDPEP